MSRFVIRPAVWSRDAPRLQAVRLAVFVREQGVPLELEWDEHDPISRHVIAETQDGTAVGTGRLLADGHIGRMAVLREWRKHGVGSALLQALMAMAREAGMREVVLHAQTHALGFYTRHGFRPEGEVFLEAGIAHRTMRRQLSP
jgi:predicted GNAT family N-acyltransferase